MKVDRDDGMRLRQGLVGSRWAWSTSAPVWHSGTGLRNFSVNRVATRALLNYT